MTPDTSSVLLIAPPTLPQLLLSPLLRNVRNFYHILSARLKMCEVQPPLINSSLVSSQEPEYFKTAMIQPLCKKPALDPSVLNNFCPISKLPFLAKVLEKVVPTT